MMGRFVFMQKTSDVIIFLLLIFCNTALSARAQSASDEEYWTKVNPIANPPWTSILPRPRPNTLIAALGS